MANTLFNGVPLPAIPAWDKATYPHWVIFKSGNYYWVFASQGKPEAFVTSGVEFYGVQEDCLYCAAYCAVSGASEWTINKEGATAQWSDILTLAIWTNTDILDTDGTVYLKATTPIPVSSFPSDFEPRSFAYGMRVGAVIRSLRRRKAEPTHSSYNGVVLPKLPEWDKETYPHVYIHGSRSLQTDDPPVYRGVHDYLIISTAPLYRKLEENGFVISQVYPNLYAKENCVCVKYFYDSTNETHYYNPMWYPYEEATNFSDGDKVLDAFTPNYIPIWSNTDLYDYDDGTLVLEASIPIPVLEVS